MRKVLSFNELEEEEFTSAGGKGGTLARLHQAGFPVPDGFVIMPNAFADDELDLRSWSMIQERLDQKRQTEDDVSFAVRSSALSEDSAQASFAGEFETVLGAHTDEEIREAIRKVRKSRLSERVRAYSEAHGMDALQEIAVVVQQMVDSEISGILFTADPVTGSRDLMTGNFIAGLGDRLVSGEVNPDIFTLGIPQGRYEGPAPIRPYASELYELAARLEEELGRPQDIEWAVAGGSVHLLQSRPITTQVLYNAATGEHNDSLRGDYVWSSQMLGEMIPTVMTPATWSVWQIAMDQMRLTGVPTVGNICGRVYTNLSLMYSLLLKFKKPEDALEMIEERVGRLPEGVEIPVHPISWRELFTGVLPLMIRVNLKRGRLKKRIPQLIAETSDRTKELISKIEDTSGKPQLASLWHGEVFPLFEDMANAQDITNDRFFDSFTALSIELKKLIGREEASYLLATLRGQSSQLASLGTLVGLAKLRRGEMAREEFVLNYGHRGPFEDMISMPRPSEDPGWLDKLLAEYDENPVDIEDLLEKSSPEHEAAWSRLEEQHPKKAGLFRRKVDEIKEAMLTREAFRSELSRVLSVIRAFYLRAGELTSLGDDAFFLMWQELVGLLKGEDTPVKYIPMRREAYERYRSLPPYPTIIVGRFDPFRWSSDADRRGDIWDSRAPLPRVDTKLITGYPGSAGVVEGVVRRIDSPEEGYDIELGEILVTSTTNVGWTPLFIKIAAVVTDVGAPLSHAAIVARELGIPAVVGSGNATSRLRTGDRVRVDGGKGTVEILEPT
jgi:phosphohistidine swiveling domain-containing protein